MVVFALMYELYVLSRSRDSQSGSSTRRESDSDQQIVLDDDCSNQLTETAQSPGNPAEPETIKYTERGIFELSKEKSVAESPAYRKSNRA